MGEQTKLHLYLQLLPIDCITAWAPPPVRWAVALDSQEHGPYCAFEGSRLQAPYENLMPDDLRWSWGSDASAGSGCKYRSSLAERFDCRDHSEATACRLISKPYQWVASDKLHLVAGFKSESTHGRPVILFITSVCASFLCCTLVSGMVLVSPQANPRQNEWKTSIAGELLWKEGKTQWWDNRSL